MADERLKSFFVRQCEGIIEACATVNGEFVTKQIEPDEAIRLAAEILDHALSAKHHREFRQ